MALEPIKPRELPPAPNVYGDGALVVDDGANVQRATPVQIVDAGAPVASEDDAIEGIDNHKRMTPLRVKQVVDIEGQQYVDLAEAWAQGVPPGDDSQSAKAWAEEAASNIRTISSTDITASEGQVVVWVDFDIVPSAFFLLVNGATLRIPQDMTLTGPRQVTLNDPLSSGDTVVAWQTSQIPTSELPSQVQADAERAEAAAALAENDAVRAEMAAASIQNMTATAETLAPGTPATASINPDDNLLSLGVPAGQPGDKGDPGDDGLYADVSPEANTFPTWDASLDVVKQTLTSQGRSLLDQTILSRSGNDLVTTTQTRITGGAVVQNDTDTTAGRLLRTGYAGLRGMAPGIPDADCNNISVTGFYRVAGSTINTPYGSGPSGAVLLDIHYNEVAAGQFFIRRHSSAPEAWIRSLNAGSNWGAWSKLWSDINATPDANGFLRSSGSATAALVGHTHVAANITDFNSAADARITAQKGNANGIASLDGSGKVPSEQLPSFGVLNFLGTWDADTNTPTITSSTGTLGDFYIVSVAGSTTIDGNSTWLPGDELIFNGVSWMRIPNVQNVISVAGKTGTVVLDTGDIDGIGTPDANGFMRATGGSATAATTSDLAGKADTVHTHTASAITDFGDAVEAVIESQKGEAEGLAPLDEDGKVPIGHLPDIMQPLEDRDAAVAAWAARPSGTARMTWISPAGVIGVIESTGATDIPGMNDAVPDGIATPYHFGAICDGNADDTDAIRALHTYCNATGIPPDYSGVPVVAVASDAAIVVSTSIDFKGAKLYPIDGIWPSPDWDTVVDMFRVEDAETPVVSGSGTANVSNTFEGSRTPNAGFWAQSGWFYMVGTGSGAPQIPSRQVTGLTYYRQTFAISGPGNLAMHPLEVTFPTGATLDWTARANPSRGWITIENFRVNSADYNNQCFINVGRNMVHVRNVLVVGTRANSFSRVVIGRWAAHLRFSNFIGPNSPNPSAGGGHYFLHVIRSVDVIIDGCHSMGGHGWIATVECSGLTMTNCTVNRFDCHNGGFNFFIDNCTFNGLGVAIGWGGGQLKVSNCHFINTRGVHGRNDYDKSWYGDMQVTDCTFQDESTSLTVVDFGSYGNGPGADQMASYAPRTITIKNCRRVGNDRNNGRTRLFALQLIVRPGSQPVRAPSRIIIDGIYSGNDRCPIGNIIDLNNMTGDHLYDGRTQIHISNCPSTIVASGSDLDQGCFTIHTPPKWIGVNSALSWIKIANVTFALVNLRDYTQIARVFMSSCDEVRRVSVGMAARIDVMGCTFGAPINLTGDAVPGRLGFPRSSVNYTSVIGSRILTGSWDMSGVAMLSGVMIPASIQAGITLPAGATFATAMSGWQMSGL